MSEEITNASVTIPRSMMISMALNGTLGLGILVTVLYALGDIDEALNSPTGYACFQILTKALGSVSGACAMVGISLSLQIFAATACIAAASRQLWAFARDRAVPGWRFLVHVSWSLPFI